MVTSPSDEAGFGRNWWLALRLFLGILLVWAAVSKIGNPTKFLGDLYAYRLPLPGGWLKLAAAALPWVEMLCGILLLVGTWVESVLTLAAGLFGIFVLATGQAWLRGLKISCGCFDLKLLGLDGQSAIVQLLESPGAALIRSFILLAAAIYLGRSLGFWTTPATPGNTTPDPKFLEKRLDRPTPDSNKNKSRRH